METCRDRRNQEHLNYPEESEKLVAPEYQGYPATPGTPGDSGDSEAEGNDKDWPHHLHISPDYVQHMEKVFSIVRQKYGRSSTDPMKDFDVNTTVWGTSMSVTLQAAVHLGKHYTKNLRSAQNQPLKSVKQLFQMTERLITDQTEITGLTTIDWFSTDTSQHSTESETTLVWAVAN